MKRWLSKCCVAAYHAANRCDEQDLDQTNYYVCNECNKACDLHLWEIEIKREEG